MIPPTFAINIVSLSLSVYQKMGEIRRDLTIEILSLLAEEVY